ncbi:MAG: pyridoxamine 5'-phosphate oxidase family protein [Thermoleophilaceae bacterium]
MPNREPIETTNLDTIYGSQTIPWSRPRDLLAVGAFGPGTPFFLGTVRPDGRPHAAGIGVAWYDDDLYFQCGPKTRKVRNVAANPACTISGSLPGMDLVFEGEARRVADTPTLEAVAAVYREGGWPVHGLDGGVGPGQGRRVFCRQRPPGQRPGLHALTVRAAAT